MGIDPILAMLLFDVAGLVITYVICNWEKIMKLRQKEGWYRNRYPGEYSIQDAFEIEAGGLAGATDTVVGMVLERMHAKEMFSNEEILSMLNARNASWEEVPVEVARVEETPLEWVEKHLPDFLVKDKKVPESDG